MKNEVGMENLFEYFESPDWHVCKDSGDTPKKNGHYLVVYEDDKGKYIALMYFNTNYMRSFLYEPTNVYGIDFRIRLGCRTTAK